MRRDDRDDPFDDIFREIERLMDDVMTGGASTIDETGFGADAHVDVHETEEEVRVVADLPGVERDHLSLRCDGEMLTLDVESEQRALQEHITLPTTVDEHSADASFNNGVLEVTFERTDDSASISL
ncbi:Hsp20/alpha crystallin family protein [Salinarchaeum laminariae]|uniref:Hsp20/alpha crystallin family protein n=1 Tax=Salinarchaeum laminariae TaxID=869888 RepID=UPI0020BE128E|nr:Hsp20/alpha crystallin family protein [Salinarchaeum laminariae]